MKRFSFSERDYTFGQMMLTLRKRIGMTQVDMPKRLGVSRPAVKACVVFARLMGIPTK